MSYEVFISYSSNDKAVADAICSNLETNRLRCWIAPRDIVAGCPWAESIIEALNQCVVMVVIFSAHSNNSNQVVKEVERAVHKGISIVPFRIENVTPTKSMEYFLSSPHWLDAINPPMQEHIDRLVTAVRGVASLQRPLTEAPAPAKVAAEKAADQKFIREFQEIAPDDWSPSGNFFTRVFRKLLDES